MQITDLSEIKKHWPITKDLILHRNVANLVYFSKIESQDVVIRLTPTSQRSSKDDLYLAENLQLFDFIN